MRDKPSSVVLRSAIDHELRPLVRALRNRIDGLNAVSMEKRDGLEIYERGSVPFLALEVRRDHMNLDLWLPEEKLQDARASGIARPHPFEPNDAVRVRFDRALDLTKVARWLEAAHAHARARRSSVEASPAAEGATPKRTSKKVGAKKATTKKAARKKSTAKGAGRARA